jgi:hypothetical protein
MVQTVLLMISKTSASWQCGGASENAPDRVAAKPANGEKKRAVRFGRIVAGTQRHRKEITR